MSQDLPPIRAGDLVTPELARSLRRRQELRPKLRMWGKGLLMAVISGGANGFTAGLSAIVIAPDTFNGGTGLGSTVKLIIAAGVMAVDRTPPFRLINYAATPAPRGGLASRPVWQRGSPQTRRAHLPKLTRSDARAAFPCGTSPRPSR